MGKELAASKQEDARRLVLNRTAAVETALLAGYPVPYRQ